MEGLIAQSLRKRFRSRVVVNRVTLDIHPGEVVGWGIDFGKLLVGEVGVVLHRLERHLGLVCR